MSEIRRLGPPQAVSIHGRFYRFAVPLNLTPSSAWWTRFRDAGEWTSCCHPNGVWHDGERLLFDSSEADVPMWITFIDRWMRAANDAVSAERRGRRRGHLRFEDPQALSAVSARLAHL